MIHLLETGQTNSVELVKKSISIHEKWIHKNALANISPQALYLAAQRDEERKNKMIRGPLHGIPLVIKDNILYRDGTPTTASAYSLHDLIPPFDATIITKLIDAGAIILGKANLSEFAYFMSYDNMPSGYGSMHGQVKHPFDESVDPFGSSTGSAVAVKLGITNVAIGTETNGSLMAPAYQCQIVSFKPTFGYVSKKGIIPISPTQDTAGPMALTVEDCALLMDVMATPDSLDPSTLHLKRPQSYSKRLDEPLEHQTIGLIYVKDHPYQASELEVITNIKKRLNKLGHQTKDLLIEKGHLNNDPTLLIEFKYAMNTFLNEVHGSTKMSSLKDIITFNQQHEKRCLVYGQSILIKSEETHGDVKQSDYLHMREELLEQAKLFEDLMIKHQLIALVAPIWMGFAPIYGNPSLCIPEGVYNKEPKASVFVGKEYDDETLLRLGHQYQGIMNQEK